MATQFFFGTDENGKDDWQLNRLSGSTVYNPPQQNFQKRNAQEEPNITTSTAGSNECLILAIEKWNKEKLNQKKVVTIKVGVKIFFDVDENIGYSSLCRETIAYILKNEDESKQYLGVWY